MIAVDGDVDVAPRGFRGDFLLAQQGRQDEGEGDGDGDDGGDPEQGDGPERVHCFHPGVVRRRQLLFVDGVSLRERRFFRTLAYQMPPPRPRNSTGPSHSR